MKKNKNKKIFLILSWCFLPYPSSLYQAHRLMHKKNTSKDCDNRDSNNNNPRKGLLLRHEWSELTEVKTVFSYVGKFPDDRGFFFLPTISDSAYISDKACFSYVGKIPEDRGFYFFSTIPDFAYIPDNRQKTVPDSPYYELGGKWKVCKKSSLEQKCNSIYTATLMHTSLCCDVLNRRSGILLFRNHPRFCLCIG